MDIALSLVPSQVFSASHVGGFREDPYQTSDYIGKRQGTSGASTHGKPALFYGSDGKDVVSSMETGSMIDIYA